MFLSSGTPSVNRWLSRMMCDLSWNVLPYCAVFKASFKGDVPPMSTTGFCWINLEMIYQINATVLSTINKYCDQCIQIASNTASPVFKVHCKKGVGFCYLRFAPRGMIGQSSTTSSNTLVKGTCMLWFNSSHLNFTSLCFWTHGLKPRTPEHGNTH